MIEIKGGAASVVSAAGDIWCALRRITYTRGSMFIGNELDAATRKARGRLELDPADLLTHGLIVGMTGSGKTGLAIVLIEEALRQGVPVLAIDPKGDLGNLLLLFDRLDPDQFAAWVDREAARRQGPARAF